MPILLEIALATLISTVLSVVLAGLISFRFLDRYMSKMLCISAGLLLTVAFTHLLPEAFEIHEHATSIGWTLLISVLILCSMEFLFNRPDHDKVSGIIEESRSRSMRSGAAILVGDSLHNFTDGILIASSFMVSSSLGWVTAMAIMAHEVPQEVGDFMVLLHSNFSRRMALLCNLLSGFLSILGGVIGYFLLDTVKEIVPYAFAIAAASFIYIALSDLIPEIVRKQKSGYLIQIFFILLGVAVAVIATGNMHVH